jgi:hypothetical protein
LPPGGAVEPIVAAAAEQGVVAEAAVQDVAVGPAIQPVRAAAAIERVVPAAAVQRIGRGGARQAVGIRAAGQGDAGRFRAGRVEAEVADGEAARLQVQQADRRDEAIGAAIGVVVDDGIGTVLTEPQMAAGAEGVAAFVAGGVAVEAREEVVEDQPVAGRTRFEIGHRDGGGSKIG